MELIKRPGRRYRRYRHENRYDSPLLIFCLDTCLTLLKILLIASLLLSGWVVLKRLATSAESNSIDISAETSGAPASSVETASVTVQNANPVVGSSDRQNSDATLLVSTNPTDSENPAGNTAITHDGAATKAGSTDDTAAKSVAPREKPAESGKQANIQVKPEIVGSKWVQGLNPAHYIMQFGASPDRSLLDQFIPVINQGEPIAVYPFKRNRSGKPVYGIATGVYKTGDAALAAIESFSAQARAYDPWVRKISDLKEDIASLTNEALQSK